MHIAGQTEQRTTALDEALKRLHHPAVVLVVGKLVIGDCTADLTGRILKDRLSGHKDANALLGDHSVYPVVQLLVL